MGHMNYIHIYMSTQYLYQYAFPLPVSVSISISIYLFIYVYRLYNIGDAASSAQGPHRHGVLAAHGGDLGRVRRHEAVASVASCSTQNKEGSWCEASWGYSPLRPKHISPAEIKG